MKKTWIGPLDTPPAVGSIRFLVKLRSHTKGWEKYELRDMPDHTQESLQPRLEGWCGRYNDVSTYACGLAKAVRLAKNGRVLVESVDPDSPEGEATLEELGYPDLS